MKDKPLFSVITAVYNGAPYLRELIESVLAQDYDHFEHIIIDDGSNDNGETVSILQSYPHLRWWSRENRGQYATQNEGLAAAQGDIVSIVSADDVYATPTVFNDVLNYWYVHPDCDMVYGKTLRMRQNGTLLPHKIDTTGKYPRWLIHYLSYIQHCSLFVSRDLIIERDLWFDQSFKYAGDWEWIIRLFDQSSLIGYIDCPLSIIRVHEGQTSKVASNEDIANEHRRVCKAYGSIYALHVLLRNILNLRAMVLMAIALLKYKGLAVTTREVKNWMQRRLKA